jgi:glycosyltransferase involved in cell wall biosynthesis
MRIAYIANYQGPALVKRRPIVRNLSLAARVKTERIAELLYRRSHQLEILSQGEVIERSFKVHPAFADPDPFLPQIPIFYSSAYPVRLLNAFWASISTLRVFKTRHRMNPFEVIMINNLKPPQVICAGYGILRFGLPVVLQYEDGAFGTGKGNGDLRKRNITAQVYLAAARWLLTRVSACVAVSPDLLAQTPPAIPKLLLRGVVGDEIVTATEQASGARNNWIVFSGTHFRAYGLEQLITAWSKVNVPGWELHIAGQGELTETLQRIAQGDSTIVFHGLLNRQQNARFLASAKIGINPHDTGHTSGNVFAFKIIEYLAAGNHVITTPMGVLQPELEIGLTYMKDNSASTIASAIEEVIHKRLYERTAARGALQHYGAEAVSRSLETLLQEALNSSKESRQHFSDA